MEFTIESFQKALGDVYEKLDGKFKEKKFDELLNEFKFGTSVSRREILRSALKERGFFEKGNYT